jgi:hypothetical protein
MDYKEKIDKAFKENVPETEMSSEDFRFLLKLLMNEDANLNIDLDELDKNSEIYKYFKSTIESFLAQIILTRIKHLTTLKMSLGALIGLLTFMENAGDCVVYTLYLQYKLEPNSLVTLRVFCEEALPHGMFSREQLKNIWSILKSTDDTTKNL